MEETDTQQHCNLHPNKGFDIEIHAYRIIEHSVVKLTTSRIVKLLFVSALVANNAIGPSLFYLEEQ